jgi:hypothetical protein
MYLGCGESTKLFQNAVPLLDDMDHASELMVANTCLRFQLIAQITLCKNTLGSHSQSSMIGG